MDRMRSPAVKGVLRRCCSRRSLTSSGTARAQVQSAATTQTTAPGTQNDAVIGAADLIAPRTAGRGTGDLSRTYFDATGVRWVGIGGSEPPQDPNKANLGKTLRILQDRLPTLLQSPLPQDILAPNISLNLFPSTHPHLPTVSGRVAYNAALWTSPIAWNRLPLIGNVRLEILAERMTAEPLTFLPRRPGAIPEQLVVRWCERRKVDENKRKLEDVQSAKRGEDPRKSFTGLFIFDFDKEGRILTHTIETAQESGNWEKGMGAKFVGLTDWLLGGIKDPGGTVPVFEQLGKKQ